MIIIKFVSVKSTIATVHVVELVISKPFVCFKSMISKMWETLDVFMKVDERMREIIIQAFVINK